MFIEKTLAKLSRSIFPSYSHCKRCGFTWNIVSSKIIYINHRSGCFATCIKCWNKASFSELTIYYTDLYNSWDEQDYTLDHLLECVKAEKAGKSIYKSPLLNQVLKKNIDTK